MNEQKILVTAIVVVLFLIGVFAGIEAAAIVGCVSITIVFGIKAIVNSTVPYDEEGNYIAEGDTTMGKIGVVMLVLVLVAVIAGVALMRG